MCEERLENVEAEGLEASHPRIAGIVQTHRQQVDTAQIGRQQVRTKDIKKSTVTALQAGCQVFAGCYRRIAFMSNPHGRT